MSGIKKGDLEDKRFMEQYKRKSGNCLTRNLISYVVMINSRSVGIC